MPTLFCILATCVYLFDFDLLAKYQFQITAGQFNLNRKSWTRLWKITWSKALKFRTKTLVNYVATKNQTACLTTMALKHHRVTWTIAPIYKHQAVIMYRSKIISTDMSWWGKEIEITFFSVLQTWFPIHNFFNSLTLWNLGFHSKRARSTWQKRHAIFRVDIKNKVTRRVIVYKF